MVRLPDRAQRGHHARTGEAAYSATSCARYLFQVAASTTNASLGIVALLILDDVRPVLAFALVPPAALVLAGQIAASESQRRADRNEFLYRTTEILHSTRQMGERAGELLNGITEMFGV